MQRLCAEERTEGAAKFGRSWKIPLSAKKPLDPRRDDGTPTTTHPSRRTRESHTNLMPLMNTAFEPGHAKEFIQSLEEGPRKDIAATEYAYFSGNAQEADRIASAYLEHHDSEIKLSACLICAYANLPLGRITKAQQTLTLARDALVQASTAPPPTSFARLKHLSHKLQARFSIYQHQPIHPTRKTYCPCFRQG